MKQYIIVEMDDNTYLFTLNDVNHTYQKEGLKNTILRLINNAKERNIEPIFELCDFFGTANIEFISMNKRIVKI